MERESVEVFFSSKTGKAQEFHIKIFNKNQMDSNLPLWESQLDVDTVDTDVSYFAKDFHWGYEPVYIAQKSAPPYHERFVGYGGTRNTQVNKKIPTENSKKIKPRNRRRFSIL